MIAKINQRGKIPWWCLAQNIPRVWSTSRISEKTPHMNHQVKVIISMLVSKAKAGRTTRNASPVCVARWSHNSVNNLSVHCMPLGANSEGHVARQCYVTANDWPELCPLVQSREWWRHVTGTLVTKAYIWFRPERLCPRKREFHRRNGRRLSYP